ncbi:MAG: HlyD family secretion protein [Sphingobacteriales bacterium JAD_PAG50586_3]|nr:MAG: HlyD family secretion protein [Sphingobacteriales bacterium JAD_PAG50586_3]
MLNLSKNSVEIQNRGIGTKSLELVTTPNSGKTLSRILVALFVMAVLLLFVPWQQNINGHGALTALSPADRPQTLQSPIGGRIDKWHKQEGDYVKKGDTIITISEIREKYLDPDILKRLSEQIGFKKQSIDANENKAISYSKQIEALIKSRDYKLQQALNKIKQAKLKVQSDSIDLVATKVQYAIADTQFTRSTTLFKKGVLSLTNYENRKRSFNDALAKLLSQENKLLDAKNNYLNAVIEQSSITADYGEKISKAESELNGTTAYIGESQGDLSKLQNEFTSTAIRSGFYIIRAPQDGYLVKALKAGIGENIKEGEAIATIMPDNPQMAVELFVKPIDVVLLKKGTKVRLQFDGWPALVFSGWPGTSTGTFGGVVKVIDYVDSKKGQYRVLVVPDGNDEQWPSQLRVGTGVYGWGMLNKVPLWYEIWRRLNGFPPDLTSDETSVTTTEKSK